MQKMEMMIFYNLFLIVFINNISFFHFDKRSNDIYLFNFIFILNRYIDVYYNEKF